jgi:uncharacterized protein (DUF608 family)
MSEHRCTWVYVDSEGRFAIYECITCRRTRYVDDE